MTDVTAEFEATAVQATRGTILVVEDEEDLAGMVCFNLMRQGYNCRAVHAGDEAMALIQEEPPDLVVLDRMLPGLTGDEIVARMKRDAKLSSIPVILLTAKADETDQLHGFALGADDYVTKPFSIGVLLARVAAIMRRRAETPEADSDDLTQGPVRLSLSRHEVRVDNTITELTATEFRILRTLMQARGRVLSRIQLLDAVMGPHVVVTDRTIDVHITALRKKLKAASSWVRTVRGVGYTFRSPRSGSN